MNECIPVEEIGALAQLPDDDPRRRHAAACPRCSALLFAYEEFVRAQDVEGADATDAELRLSRMIEERVENPAVATAREAGRRARGARFSFPLLRFAVVGMMVVVGAVALVRWQPWNPNEIVYRGGTGAEFTGLQAFVAEDTVWLWWDAVAGADDYRVTILSGDLQPLMELKPTTRRSSDGSESARDAFAAESRREDLPGTARYWQVTALLEGGEILTSDPQPLP